MEQPFPTHSPRQGVHDGDQQPSRLVRSHLDQPSAEVQVLSRTPTRPLVRSILTRGFLVRVTHVPDAQQAMIISAGGSSSGVLLTRLHATGVATERSHGVASCPAVQSRHRPCRLRTSLGPDEPRTGSNPPRTALCGLPLERSRIRSPSSCSARACAADRHRRPRRILLGQRDIRVRVSRRGR